MKPDISTWGKPGHFYFVLTRILPRRYLTPAGAAMESLARIAELENIEPLLVVSLDRPIALSQGR